MASPPERELQRLGGSRRASVSGVEPVAADADVDEEAPFLDIRDDERKTAPATSLRQPRAALRRGGEGLIAALRRAISSTPEPALSAVQQQAHIADCAPSS